MESAHKPVIIPPLKRQVKKPRLKGSNVPPNIRRIHSQDIVTRMPRDDVLSDKLIYNNSLLPLSNAKTPESPSFPKHRSMSHDVITSRSQTSTLDIRAVTPDADMLSGGSEYSFNNVITHLNSNCDSIRECSEEQSIAVNDLELGHFSNTSTCNSADEESGRDWSSPSRNVSLSEPLKAVQQADVLEVEASATEECALNSSKSEDHYLTLTGTIKRGKKAGQCIDVKLNMSREELEKLEADLSKKLQPKEQVFGTKSGIHITLLTIFCAPLVFLISGVYGFYLGTCTWYNIYVHFSDERTIWHKIFICPFLVLTYPFWIPPLFIGIGLFAAAVQISWYYDRWLSEVQDLEKGFFGWLCASLRLYDCSPYEVIILNDVPAGKDAKITETTML